MKRYLLAVPLLLCAAHVLADTSAAVAETNTQAGLNTGDTYGSSNRSSYMYNLNGGANFPLARYVGATLSAAYGHTKIATNPFPDVTPASPWPACGVRSEELGAGLFVRKPTFGKIGVGYGTGWQKLLCNATFLATGTDTLNTRHSTASAEYYFSTVTVAVARSTGHLESSSRIDSDTLAASWYPIDDARITLSADGLDFKNTSHLDIEYQPMFLDKSVSLLFDYTLQHQTLTSHSINIGFRYFFDVNIDLLTRDRHYR